MILIGLTGFKQSGKSTAARLLVEEFGFRRYGFADVLRQVAMALDPMIWTVGTSNGPPCARYSDLLQEFGYERCKDIPDFRRFLQRLGTDAVRDCLDQDAWVRALALRIGADAPDRAVIDDCRFQNEAAYITHTGCLWRIERTDAITAGDTHRSETEIPFLPASRVIRSASKEHLQESVRKTTAAYLQEVHAWAV